MGDNSNFNIFPKPNKSGLGDDFTGGCEMIHIAICDDDRKYAKEIELMVEECCSKTGNMYHSEIFEGSMKLIEEMEKRKYFVIFYWISRCLK